ncbi:MAG TPA: LuxR C-terminal-related transcriptional regulator, partial [Vicinamibacteria bacterium]|nr:LuxR C-terminal-related transcriptional regulator [Vicinamibacteria bacterium]
SEHTVKFHVNAILGKLGVQGRTEAVVQAARLGLITL